MITVVKATVHKPDGVWRKGVLLRIKNHEGIDYLTIEDANDNLSYEVNVSTILRIMAEYYEGVVVN